MNVLLSAETVKTEVPETKLSILKSTHLKTRTKLDFQFTEESIVGLSVLDDTKGDVQLLGVQGQPVKKVMLTTSDVKSIGRFINRSIRALSRIGITLSDLPWDATAGVVEIENTLSPFNGNDLPILTEIVARMIGKANTTMGWTHHDLTLYDFKQATGLVHDVMGGVPTAISVMNWINARELIILEGVKQEAAEQKKIAKAERHQMKVEATAKKKADLKARPKPDTKGTKDKAPKDKAAPKAKAKNASKGKAALKTKSGAANLTNLT